MLSHEDNELLCRVGPGTPGGEFHRRYWQPIAAVAELMKNPVKKVRILDEDLVLYRDLNGRLGLIADKCAHRSTGLEFGIPDQIGLRCPYHGWLYDETGQCRETPLEASTSKLAARVCIKSYPVQQLGGLLFAYLGPKPAPLLPRWDLFVWPNSMRQIGTCVIRCNWLQIQENGLDPRHNEFLHGHFFKYILERQGRWKEQARPMLEMNSAWSKHELELHKYGFIQTLERAAVPPYGKPYRGVHSYVVFPNANRKGGKRVRGEFQIRVPIDDTTTYHINYQIYTPPSGFEVPKQEVVPHYEIPRVNEKGEPILDCVIHQDIVAWESQGKITDRTREQLCGSDAAIVAYRRLLKEQIEIVKNGGTPMNVFRDPEENSCLNLVPPMGSYDAEALFEKNIGYGDDFQDRFGPLIDEVRKLMKAISASVSTAKA